MSMCLTRLTTTRWLYVVALVLGLMQAVVFDFAFDAPLKWLAPLLSLLSLGGFLALLQYLTPRRALLFGYAFGLGVFGWGLNWVYISMARFGGAPIAFAVAANVAVVMYLALYWMLAAYLVTRLVKAPNQRLLIAPAVIALLEWVRSVFLLGFPWLSVGYGFVDVALAQWASVGGVFFVSFVVVLIVSLLLLNVSRHYRLVLWVGVALLGMIVPIALTPSSSEGKSTTVALVQGNMPVITEYDDARMTQNLVRYMKLTDELLANHTPDVVIWPEAAIPYFYIESKDFLSSIHDEQRDKGFDLITGVPHGDWSKPDTIYNSILLQREDNPKPQFYNKQHLLPFGEYLPFRSVFAFFEGFVDIPMSDFARGELAQKPFMAGGLAFSASICFEAVFGNEIRQNAQQAQVLLNLSNDAWFGRSKAQAQHLNIARMRAIENQKMLVRVTNDGLTAIVNAAGEVQKSLLPFSQGTLIAEVNANNKQTLYSLYGDFLIILLCCLYFIVVINKCYKITKS